MPIQKTTVEAILIASIEVFRRQGYYRTSMADLAKATGMTKGVFYHHFSNKEEIMLKALKKSSQYFEQKVFSIAYEEKLAPKVRFEKMFQQAYLA
ncbi:MAG: helix-turn-helix domain-containing protein, partial [Bacteroidota bacterium]